MVRVSPIQKIENQRNDGVHMIYQLQIL